MLKRYELRSTRETHEGWAIFVLDTDRGFFSVVSDFGNYAYLWSSTGCEFRKFLIECDADYLHGKLMMGRPDREVFDGHETKKCILETLEEHNKGYLDDETGEGGWEHYASEMNLLEEWAPSDRFDDERAFEEWVGATRLSDAYECARHIPKPQSWQFCTKVMPRFKAMLKAELEAETP